MNVGVDLANVVEVTVGDTLHVCRREGGNGQGVRPRAKTKEGHQRTGEFLIFIEERVEVPLARKVFESPEGKRLGWAIGADRENVLEVDEVFPEGGEVGHGLLGGV